MSSSCSQLGSRFTQNSSRKKEHRTSHATHRELKFRWKASISSQNEWIWKSLVGMLNFFNTIVHFPATIVIQAGVLETWAIDTVYMKSLKELIQISPGDLFNTCAPVSAQLVSPCASDAVSSTTDAHRNAHVTFSRSSHVIWVKEQTQRSIATSV